MIVALTDVEALVLELAGADVSATAALELGHALGNRHWGLAVRDAGALFPVTDSGERMETLGRDLLPEGVSVRYESAPPTTFDDATPDHDHGGGTDGHDHGDGTDGHHRGHSHPHGDHDVRTIDGGDR
ncbi:MULTISPECIES: hypothetical protein [Haloarcula]|uniref:hypothetical protein n=1 Tax=Haloarcula TaxID=2237 RepID=UPI0030102222